MQPQGKQKANKKQTPRIRKKDLLPHDWRKRVVEMLAEQGITVHPQRVTNILNGQHRNLELHLRIEECRQKVIKEFARARRKLETMKKVA